VINTIKRDVKRIKEQIIAKRRDPRYTAIPDFNEAEKRA